MEALPGMILLLMAFAADAEMMSMSMGCGRVDLKSSSQCVVLHL
jgi:hypothetical protein